MLVTIPSTLLASAGNLSIIVSTPSAASTSAPATFVVYGPGPQVWAVANSASYTTSTITPGGIITIYGINLGPANLISFPGTNPIPTSLPTTGNATTILIDGTAAPILYTSATQVSCIVPFSLAAKSGNSVQMSLGYGGVPSSAFTLNVVDADPGLFTVDASGTGQRSMYHHFTGKGDLAAEALRESALVLRAEAEALLTGPGSPLGRIETYLTRQRDSLRGCRVGR